MKKLHEVVPDSFVEGVMKAPFAILQVVIAFVIDPFVGGDVVGGMNHLGHKNKGLSLSFIMRH